MDGKEFNEVYDFLVDTLKQKGLRWVATQVTEQVKLGKTVEKEIETFKEFRDKSIEQIDYLSEIPLKKGPKATFPITEEYSQKEKLILLIDAIEQAVVNTSEMEYHIVDFLENEQVNLHGIEFYLGEAGEESHKITKPIATTRRQNGNRLKELLVKLRKEVEENGN